MAKRGTSDHMLPRSTLLLPREEARAQIQERIRLGRRLLELQIRNQQELDRARAERKKWSEYNSELLKRIVDTDDLYHSYNPISGIVFGSMPLEFKVKDFYQMVEKAIGSLESIYDRLGLIPEKESEVAAKDEHAPVRSDSGRIFIVHGHDEEAKQTVARLVERLGLEPIILHEMPSEGRTIIEKFEDSSNVSYAIVILTPDDYGGKDPDPDRLQPRARQNVIFELGFFLGCLGRRYVCALHKGGLELPSDYSGVIWLPMDDGEGWKLDLAREMKTAGLEVDLNKLA